MRPESDSEGRKAERDAPSDASAPGAALHPFELRVSRVYVVFFVPSLSAPSYVSFLLLSISLLHFVQHFTVLSEIACNFN